MPMWQIPRRTRAGAAVALAVVLAAGGGWWLHLEHRPSPDGPLGLGDGSQGSEGWCIPDGGIGKPISWGDFGSPNHSRNGLVIDSITAHTNPTADYLGAYVLPEKITKDGGTLGVGTVHGFRPDRPGAQRLPARIPPRHAGDLQQQAYSYVLGVRRTGATPARLTHMVIHYHDTAGHRYYYKLSGHGIVAANCAGLW